MKTSPFRDEYILRNGYTNKTERDSFVVKIIKCSEDPDLLKLNDESKLNHCKTDTEIDEVL